jgi:hypothetical protein
MRVDDEEGTAAGPKFMMSLFQTLAKRWPTLRHGRWRDMKEPRTWIAAAGAFRQNCFIAFRSRHHWVKSSSSPSSSAAVVEVA